MIPPINRYEVRGACPACGLPAVLIADARIGVGTKRNGVIGRVTEVRHATATGNNNCAGIA